VLVIASFVQFLECRSERDARQVERVLRSGAAHAVVKIATKPQHFRIVFRNLFDEKDQVAT